MKKVKISAPATVANLVCGFDILGMALNDPNDIMEVSLLDEPVIRIKHADDYNLPVEPAKNVWTWCFRADWRCAARGAIGSCT